MKDDTVRPTVTARSRIRRMILVPGVVVMLMAFSFSPAEATTTFTVNETGDAADADITDDRCDTDPAVTGRQCTLRAAIEEANDTTGADTIAFDIVIGTNPAKTISPTSELPAITETATIDGYTQTGASPNTLAEGNDAILNVQLDGLDAGSDASGLVIEAPGCTIKGLVIRRFDLDGVAISDAAATGNWVEGNFIGVNRDGTVDRGNGNGGVYVRGDSNVIGGTNPASRNVISGNDSSGIDLGFGAEDNKIEGNYIGTTSDGTSDLGNGSGGVLVSGAFDNVIGGTVAGARNVISGNRGDGVYFFGAAATQNRVEGNFIGTTANGRSDLGNTGSGLLLLNGPNFNVVGGTVSGAGNRIAHNDGNGVWVASSATAHNFILSNRIYANAGLGIDLVGGSEDADGVTANDADDPDTGPNNLQNFPVIRSATKSSATGDTTISGRLNSNPSGLFEVQCFLTNGASASAHGEGSRLLDTEIVSTSSAGNVRFSCGSSLPLLGQVPGQTVSATATNLLSGDTSEFSKNRTITNAP